MNWARALIAGVVAGIVMNLVSFVGHGVLLRDTYTEYPVFTQEAANPVWFFVIAILIGIFAAILFAKTRACWAAGVAGGVAFGFWLSLVAFFSNFYSPLVLEGFPYFLSWWWGAINVVEGLLGGAVLGALYKKA